MELCRFGSLYKVIEYARRVSYLPAEVRSGRVPPRNQDEVKLKASWLLFDSDFKAVLPELFLVLACPRPSLALALAYIKIKGSQIQ